MSKSTLLTALTHDLTRKRSFVRLVWDDEAEKAVSLPVPFGCGLDVAQNEAEKALRALSAEIATISVGGKVETSSIINGLSNEVSGGGLDKSSKRILQLQHRRRKCVT